MLKGLGAAIVVAGFLVIGILIAAMILAPTWERVKYYDYQIQLSQQRENESNNVTKVIMGVIGGAVIAGVVGMYLYASGRAEARDLEMQRMKLEAQLEMEKIKAQAYRQALVQAERQAYRAQLPVGSDYALAHPRR